MSFNASVVQRDDCRHDRETEPRATAVPARLDASTRKNRSKSCAACALVKPGPSSVTSMIPSAPTRVTVTIVFVPEGVWAADI